MDVTLYHIIPALCALFVWWFGTGAVFFLNSLPRDTHRWSLLLSTLAAVAALYGIHAVADSTSLVAAYVGFLCAVVLWGWQELCFLLGYVTGPRRGECPKGARRWQRFRYATEALLYHELAILMTGAVIAVISWEGPNHIGLWTFALLYGMRLSAKLNIFLGVANLTEDMLPPDMAHLSSYSGRRKINLLFPISVMISSGAIVWFFIHATAPGADILAVTGYSLLTSFAVLGLLEHWMMILPVQETALWTWAVQHRRDLTGTGVPSDTDETKDGQGVTLSTLPPVPATVPPSSANGGLS